MHHDHFFFSALQNFGGDHVCPANFLIIFGIFEALTLHTGDVEHIGFGQGTFEGGVLGLGYTFFIEFGNDFTRHLQNFGRNVVDVNIKKREQARQRMDCASIFEIAQHGDRDAIGIAKFFEDGEEVEQCLGRVFADSISGVDDRFTGIFCRQRRRADLGMAQHDDISVALEGAHGIGQ